MTYEDIVRAWNSQADEHNQYDTLSDRERIEFSLSMAGQVEKLKADVAELEGVRELNRCAIKNLKAERDELAAQVEKMRIAIDSFLVANDPTEFGCACDPSVGYLCGPCSTHKRQTVLREAVTLPDISTSALNKVRTDALRNAVDLVIDLGDDSSTLDARTLTAAAKAIANLALDVGMDATPSKEKPCSTRHDAPHGFVGLYVHNGKGWEPDK